MFDKTSFETTYKKKKNHEPNWRTKTWSASVFYNNCRTWFIKIIKAEGKGKPFGFY